MIHAFKYSNKYFLSDVESGSIFLIDSDTYNIVSGNCEGIESETAEEIKKELSEIETPESQKEIPDFSTAKIKALCLHAAHDCNLACAYCFGEKGAYGKREIMSLKTAKAAIDYLLINSVRKNLEVDFFGGEPLINFEVVKQTVKYAREQEKKYGKNIRFTLTTNCYHITDEMIDFINSEIKNIVLSIDGRQEVHDKLRPTAGGGKSFEKVLKNAKRIVEKRGDQEYYIRGTFTNHNLDFKNDVKFLAEQGFKHISLEPVVTGLPMKITDEHLPAIFDEYDKLADFLEENSEINFFHFNIDLESGPCLIKRIRGCGAGNEYLAVAPDGKIYPCHQFAGREQFVLGNVFDGIINSKIPQEFFSANIFNKQECFECFAKYYCSGGCCANSFNTCGDILTNDQISCKLMRRRVEIALAKAALKKTQDTGEL